MNDNWIAQAVRTHVLDGPSQSELTRSDIASQSEPADNRWQVAGMADPAAAEQIRPARSEADIRPF